MQHDLAGFVVRGRNGALGVVVGVSAEDESDVPAELVVRGGVSGALRYFVPLGRIRAVSAENRTILLDLDVTDFVPTLHQDGTIELHASPR